MNSTDKLQCNQTACSNDAAFRYTWPGRPETGICTVHAPHLMEVAKAMGLHIQLVPLSVGELPPNLKVKL